MTTTPTTRAELKAMLLKNPDALAEAVITGLAAAGSEPEWDSETIEHVLSPFDAIVAAVGLPWVGSTADSSEAVNAWRRMDPDNWDLITDDEWDDDLDED